MNSPLEDAFLPYSKVTVAACGVFEARPREEGWEACFEHLANGDRQS